MGFFDYSIGPIEGFYGFILDKACKKQFKFLLLASVFNKALPISPEF
jgi:hypothetical protein